jgi:hypothetical protein
MLSAMRAPFWIMLVVMRDSRVDLFGASRHLVKRKINVYVSRRKRVTTIGTKGGKGLGYPKIYWGIVRAFTWSGSCTPLPRKANMLSKEG